MLVFMALSYLIYRKKPSYIPILFGVVGVIACAMAVFMDDPYIVKGVRNGMFLLCLMVLFFSQYFSSSRSV